MFDRHTRIALSLAAAAWVPTGGSAQARPDSIPADSLRAYVLEGIPVSVPRSTTSAGGVAAVRVRFDSMNVVPAPTLEEVLRALPLVQIRENSRGEAQPALRGAEDRQIAILVDGVPLTLGWDHRTDLSVVPMTAARGLDLHRGLASLLYGPNVLGGVVEIDVARGRGRMAAPPPLTASASLDQEGATNLAASVGRLVEVGAGEWLVRAGVGFRDRPGVPLPDLTLEDAAQRALLAGDGALRRNSDVRKIDAFFASRYQRDSGAWFSTSVSGFAAERGVPPEFHESDPRLWRYPDQKRLVAAVSAGTGLRDTGWGRGDLEAAVGIDVGSFTIESFDDLDYRTVTETEEGDDRTLTLRLLGDHSVGERADLRAALTYGDVSHDEVLMPGGRNAFRQRLWSLATELDVRGDALLGLPGTKGTRLTFGVAVDGSDTPETGDKPPVERLWDWGARVGLSTLLSDELRVHGGLSRRVRFPSLRELYSGALGRFLPNPDLGPERMVGAELGFTLHHGGHDIQVVGFRQVLSDGIVRVSVDTPEGRKRQRVNQDRVRALGLEVLTSGTWRRFSYAADLTWQSVWQFDARGDRTRPEYEPDLTGSFSVATRLAAGIMGTGEFGYLGTQYCLDSDAGGLRRLDDASSLDLGLRRFFRLGRGPFSTLDASVRVQNVTDAAVLDQCGLPRPGRTLQVQARVF